MLTAILTHHLGWVPTVSGLNSTKSPRSECGTAAIEQRAKLLKVSQKHPYNALWAQMGDLFGAIGMPPKLARTIVFGTQKLPVERLLNTLTYFIRCSEVRRSAKREVFNKQNINRLISQKRQEVFNKSAPRKTAAYEGSNGCASGVAGAGRAACHTNMSVGGHSVGRGLTRSQTCKQNLAKITSCDDRGGREDKAAIDQEILALNLKKNEIPNVLAFRDSRFVQQELRIGNYLMDTGIEKSAVLQRGLKEGRIRLTVTTPENVELFVEDDIASNETYSLGDVEDGALEAIEIDAPTNCQKTSTATVATETTASRALDKHVENKRKSFFWNMMPNALREGLNRSGNSKMERHASLQTDKEIPAPGDMQTCSVSAEKSLEQVMSHISLSDLITQNSIGKSDRMTWGLEPAKEHISYEEEMHFDLCTQLIEREHGICTSTNIDNDLIKNKNSGSDVVFVLGDNEPLINIKRANDKNNSEQHKEKLTGQQQKRRWLQRTSSLEEKPQQPVGMVDNSNNSETTLCALHQRMHAPLTSGKKHSGVKFNFEQYPQIATNYMKSKNLVLSHYNLLMDKCFKLEAEDAANASASTTKTAASAAVCRAGDDGDLADVHAALPTTTTTTTTAAATSDCIVCNSMVKTYQTPSNATELEFETDQVHCYSSQEPQPQPQQQQHKATNSNSRFLPTVSSATSVETLKSAEHQQSEQHEQLETEPHISIKMSNENLTQLIEESSTNYVPAKFGNGVDRGIQLLQLPVPNTKDLPPDDDDCGHNKWRTGFIPSMFLNISDHYISDMVLQVRVYNAHFDCYI